MVVIECSNVGVPLTFDTKDSGAPPRGVPYDISLFDLARGAPPPADDPAGEGEAPLRIRVTTYVDGQLLGMSFNHVLGDAASFNLFLIAWGEVYRGASASEGICHDRVAFWPETPAGPAEPPLAGDPSAEREEWHLLHQTAQPVAVTTADTPPLWSVVSYFRTFEEVAALKAEHSGTSDGAMLSSIDVLTAEVIHMCRFEGDNLRLHIVKQFREELGCPTFFGNAMTFLGVDVPNSKAASVVIRKAVSSCRSKAFVQWKQRQTWCGFELTDTHLMVNSWFRSVRPELIVFAGAAESVGFAKKTYDDEVGERARKSPMVHILPHRDGFRIYLFVRRSVAHALRDAGALQSCTDLGA